MPAEKDAFIARERHIAPTVTHSLEEICESSAISEDFNECVSPVTHNILVTTEHQNRTRGCCVVRRVADAAAQVEVHEAW